ncbi:formin homology 2 domain containing protein [Nitzschia inconspicua]|uniref:Formin homology 2 domain containing protein n=1 Tax=Nitzschia inconspicua TaxID=303405 RepID=A0A9K3LT68_9STRA|nr:formin homology 2 domain containing protein [Nitzschia inconspicua]
MVSRLFGSPSGQGGNAIPVQPLNTPKSSQSRRECIEQARQDRSRRRNFGFLKAGNNEKKVESTTTLTRRREHAKQLANLAYSVDPLASTDFQKNHDKLTPTSRSAQQKLLSSYDVDSPQNAIHAPLDPFSSTTTTKVGQENNFRTSNPLFFDPHNVVASSSTGVPTVREPTASTVDTFDNSSFGSAAFDMDFLSTNLPASTTYQSPMASSARSATSHNASDFSASRQRSSSNNGNSKMTLDNFFVESSERNFASMPTIPTNSTMQANYHRHPNGALIQEDRTFTGTPSGGSVSSAQSSSNNSSIGAAARRRMRSHMKSQGGGSVISSAGVGSSAEAHSRETNDLSSFAPESPSNNTRSTSFQRSLSSISASKNRLTAYQQRSQNNNFHQRSPSFVSAGGTSVASSNNSASSPGLFDSDHVDGGFTFDAFGLDQSQVEREVNEAMQDLAGQGISGFSMFVDKHVSSSKAGTYGQNRDSFANQSDDDTFIPQNWDSSPMSSRNASPVPSHYHSNSDGGESFVDGFRVKSMSQQVRNADNSSAAPSSFASPSRGAPVTRRLQRSRNWGGLQENQNVQQHARTEKVNESKYPPKKRESPQQFDSTLSLSAKKSIESPHMSFFHDPVVTNPWKEDPWASDDGNGGDDTNLFFAGDTQSDVQDYRGSYESAATRGSDRRLTSYSDVKSEVGVSTALSHASFYRLPPEELHPPKSSGGAGYGDEDSDDSDDSDAISQMQEDMTREFAMDLMRRVSPANRGNHSGGRKPQVHVNSPSSSKNESQQKNQPEEPETPSIRSRHSFRTRLFRDSLHRSSNAANAPPSETTPVSTHLHNNKTSENHRQNSSSKSRFTSFRSNYDSQARGNVVGNHETASVPKSSSSTLHQECYDNNATEAPETPSSSRTANCITKPHVTSSASDLDTKHSPKPKIDPQRSSRCFEDSYNSPTTSNRSQSQVHLPTTQPENAGRDDSSEEKKEEDETGPSASSCTLKVGSLKARWEAQSRVRTPSEVEPVKSHEFVPPSGKAREGIGKMDNAFEMLTPAIVEARRLEKQRNRSADLRKSLGVVDEKKFPSSKSEAGVSYATTVAERILNQVRGVSTRESPSPRQQDDTKSDGGSTPSFLAGVKLRKVTSAAACAKDESQEEGSPFSQHISNSLAYSENRNLAASEKDASRINQDQVEESTGGPIERKMTYRERREMELQHEKQEKDRLDSASTETPKKDVASLIRKRIAANKQRNVTTQRETSSEDLTNIRGRLKCIDEDNGYHHTSRKLSNAAADVVERTFVEKSRNFESNLHSDPQGLIPSSREPSIHAVFPSLPTSNRTTGVADDGFTNTKKADIRLLPKGSPLNKAEPFLAGKSVPPQTKIPDSSSPPVAVPVPDVPRKVDVPDDISQADVKSMLSSFLGSRAPPALPLPSKEDDTEALKKHHVKSPTSTSPKQKEESPPPPPPPSYNASGSRPALKDDPKFERYFRMLKMGLPLEVAKHAMERDGLDPTVLDLDHEKPIGIPLKEDPKFDKYFKMLKIGISMDQVKHAMERDGLNPNIMDQDHSLPVLTIEKRHEKKQKETHRRARLHWKTIGNVVRNSLWAKVESEISDIDIDEEEFNELFKADLKGESNGNKAVSNSRKKGAAVRVIDAKRANNGGIILARLKMTHDEMADAVDRIDSDVLTAEQIENIVEYLPTKEEREALEQYMLEGGQDAAEKFDGLCECEKFMVSMMTVKHAKRKIRALLFKLQFMSCMESIAEDAQTIDNACDELSHSNRLRQLLGIILQFGNRLNTAGVNSKSKAGAFTLDSLLKLKEAKAFDKKTTFLHYIILIVQRNNELLLKYYDDLPTVLKADKVFWDQCLQDLEEVENQLENVRRISLYEAKLKKQYKLKKSNDAHSDEDSLGDMELSLEEEVDSLRGTPSGVFTLGAIKQVSALRDKIDRTKAKFARVLEYFGEDSRKMQPHELFTIISAFTRDFQKAKEEVFSTVHKRLREDRKKARNKTPTKQNGLPPPGPDRATKPMLRSSDHQPNMSVLFNEMQQRGSSPPSTTPPSTKPIDGNVSSMSSRAESTAPQSYRNMSRKQEIPEGAAQSPSMRPYSHHHLDGEGKSESGGYRNVALAPQISSRIQHSESNRDDPVIGALPPQATARSPRDALRNRRRVEAMRARSARHVPTT